jgi:DNA-binding CsgD family transcriptional regulator
MSTLSELFHSAADGVFAIDRRQRIIYWDAGCEELLGYSSNWVLGRYCCDVLQGCQTVSEKPFCKKDCRVAGLADGGLTGPKSFQIKIKNTEEKSILVTVNVVLVPAECSNGWIVTHFLHREKSVSVLNALEYAQNKRNMHTPAGSKATDVGDSQPKQRLTARESEILNLLAEGLPSNAIAERLSVSHATVRNHVQHILSKLCVHSRSEAVSYAYRHDLI